jgi:hypothetical protein
MTYTWLVLETTPAKTDGSYHSHINSGCVDTFAQALQALSHWQGAEDDPPHRLYQIIPNLPILETD